MVDGNIESSIICGRFEMEIPSNLQKKTINSKKNIENILAELEDKYLGEIPEDYRTLVDGINGGIHRCWEPREIRGEVQEGRLSYILKTLLTIEEKERSELYDSQTKNNYSNKGCRKKFISDLVNPLLDIFEKRYFLGFILKNNKSLTESNREKMKKDAFETKDALFNVLHTFKEQTNSTKDQKHIRIPKRVVYSILAAAGIIAIISYNSLKEKIPTKSDIQVKLPHVNDVQMASMFSTNVVPAKPYNEMEIIPLEILLGDSNKNLIDLAKLIRVYTSTTPPNSIEGKVYEIYHKIQPRQTFSKISNMYGGILTAEEIANLNPGVEEKNIEIGSELMLRFIAPHDLFEKYILGDIEKNRELVLEKTGDEVWEDRYHFGVGLFAQVLGIEPGKYLKGDEMIAYLSQHKGLFEKIGNEYNIEPYELAAYYAMEGAHQWTMSQSGALGPGGHTKWAYRGGFWSDNVEREAINPFDFEESIKRTAQLHSLYSKVFENEVFVTTAYAIGERNMHEAIEIAKEQGIYDINGIINVKGEDGKPIIKSVGGRDYHTNHATMIDTLAKAWHAIS